jgi:hypothetical protein
MTTTPPLTPQGAEQFIREFVRDFKNSLHQADAKPNGRSAVIERGIARLKQRDAGIRRQTIEEIRTRVCDRAPAASAHCPAISKRS